MPRKLIAASLTILLWTATGKLTRSQETPSAPTSASPQTSGAVEHPQATVIQFPRLIHPVTPIYPPDALAKRMEGTIHLRASISPDGSLQQIECIGGSVEFKDAAMEAVSRWRYSTESVKRKVWNTFRELHERQPE